MDTPLEESNLARIGSDEDKAARKVSFMYVNRKMYLTLGLSHSVQAAAKLGKQRIRILHHHFNQLLLTSYY